MTKSLVIDLTFALEGQARHELPEGLLGAVRFFHLDIKKVRARRRACQRRHVCLCFEQLFYLDIKKGARPAAGLQITRPALCVESINLCIQRPHLTVMAGECASCNLIASGKSGAGPYLEHVCYVPQQQHSALCI